MNNMANSENINENSYFVGEVDDAYYGRSVQHMINERIIEPSPAILYDCAAIFCGFQDVSGSWEQRRRKYLKTIQNELANYKVMHKDGYYFYLKWLRDSIILYCNVLHKTPPHFANCAVKYPLPNICEKQQQNGLFSVVKFTDRGAATWMYLMGLYPSEDSFNEVGLEYSRIDLDEANPTKIDMQSCSHIVVHAVVSKTSRWHKVADFLKDFARTFIDSDSTIQLDKYGSPTFDNTTRGTICTNSHRYKYYTDYVGYQGLHDKNLVRIYIVSDRIDMPIDKYINYISFDKPVYVIKELDDNVCSMFRPDLLRGFTNPNKVVLLYTIFEQISAGIICDNKIYPTESLCDDFNKNLKKYIKNHEKYRIDFYDTFYRLKSYYFWMLYDKNNLMDEEKLVSTKMQSIKFNEKYNYAILQKDYFYLFTFTWLHDVIDNIFTSLFIEYSDHLEAVEQLHERNTDFNGFVEKFQKKYNHYPTFAHINYMIDETLQPREKEIVYRMLPMNQNSVDSFSSVAEKLNLTKERVQTIYQKAIRRLSTQERLGGLYRGNYFDWYGINSLQYFTPQNIDFERIKKEEDLTFDFYAFCTLFATVISPDRYSVYKMLKPSSSGVLTKSYVCSYLISTYFRIEDALTYLKHSSIKEIRLNVVMSKKEFWLRKNISDDMLMEIKGFLTYFCQDYLDLYVFDDDEPYQEGYDEGGKTYLHIDDEEIKSAIAEILKDGPLSSQEIANRLVQRDARYAQLQSDKLTTDYLIDRTLFTPVGKKSIYQLATSSSFSGSVTKCVDFLLHEANAPISLEDLIAKTLELRPDSNYRSVRAVVLSKIKKGELVIDQSSMVRSLKPYVKETKEIRPPKQKKSREKQFNPRPEELLLLSDEDKKKITRYKSEIRRLYIGHHKGKPAPRTLILFLTILNYIDNNPINTSKISDYRIPYKSAQFTDYWDKEWIKYTKSNVCLKSDIDKGIMEMGYNYYFISSCNNRDLKLSKVLLKLLSYSEVREILRECIVSELIKKTDQ